MILTEALARTKHCCAAQAGNHNIKCQASDCMAWRWSLSPKLDIVRTVEKDEVERITGKLAPTPTDFLSPEAYYTAVDAYMKAALSDPGVVATLTHVKSEWVATHAPSYNEEECCLWSAVSRESDPTATGHCGYIGKD